MHSDQSLIVALSGAPNDRTLFRYADYLAQLNREVALSSPVTDWEHEQLSHLPGLQPSHSGQAAVLTDQGHRIVLTAPQALHFVPAPDRLKGQTAEQGGDAILVGDRTQARRLVREANCSVWFVPGEATPPIRRILVPVDFTIRAADSLRVATSLARLSGAHCLTLHVYFNDTLFLDQWSDRALQQQVREAQTRFLARIDSLGVEVLPRLREGAATARTIACTAEEESADLIVMASRGRTRGASLVLSSLACQTLCETRVPLLVVKHFGARLGLFSALREKMRRPTSSQRFN